MPRIVFALAALALLFSGTAVAGSKVRIIYPPQGHAVDLPEPAPARTINQNVAVSIVVVRPRVSNRAIVKRALFQNWTGFIYQYDGPRYPF